MFYRENGQFKTSYEADQALFPIKQDRVFIVLLLLVAFVGVPLLADRPLVGGRPTAYVCRHFVCEAPTTDPATLAALLR